jgi:signal transduction histidine kinase
MEENNGILGIESAKGKGTTISVEFPLDRQL